jgi:hypothetical protein
VHGDRLDAQFSAGSLDTQGDLATIGNENLLEHGAFVEIGRRSEHFPT